MWLLDPLTWQDSLYLSFLAAKGLIRFLVILPAVSLSLLFALIAFSLPGSRLPLIEYLPQIRPAASYPNSRSGRDDPKIRPSLGKCLLLKSCFYFLPYFFRSGPVMSRADRISAQPSFFKTKKIIKYLPASVCPIAE